jgi:pimeloyl-ACP methyl ester carboxylesterase
MKKFLFILVALLAIAVILFGSRIKFEYKNLSSITSANNIFQLRFANADSKQIIFFSDSLRIVGDYFASESKKPSPCILILHGTHVLGRKQPVILAIAKELQKLNYNILTIDLRGYNDSQDPPKIDSLADLDFAQDAISAIDYLLAVKSIDTSKIYILGHSFGAGVALSTTGRENRVKKIILFGAPRRVNERILNLSSPDRQQLLYKNINNMLLNYSVDSTILVESIKSRNIEDYIEKINQPDYDVRYFLIDGSRENIKDLQFYKEIAKKISAKADYFTVSGSDHYLNTGFFLNRAAYDKELVQNFVNKIDTWLKH